MHAYKFGWQNTWESDSRRPGHPFPALVAGVSPGRVPVHTALKRHPSRHLSLNNDRHANHNRGIDNVLQLRHERGATVGSRLSSQNAPVEPADLHNRGRASTGCNCGISTVYSTTAPVEPAGHARKPASTSCNCGISNVFSTSAPTTGMKTTVMMSSTCGIAKQFSALSGP